MTSQTNAGLRFGSKAIALLGAMMMAAPNANAGPPWWYYGLWIETTTTYNPDGSRTNHTTLSIECGGKDSVVGTTDSHTLQLAAHVEDGWAPGELTLLGADTDQKLVYDADLSRERNELWPSENGTWQVYTSAEMLPPPTTDLVEFEVQAVWSGPAGADMLDTLQVHLTNDAPERYDQWVSPALASATLHDTASADLNINVSGGTENSVVHSCSTVGPVGGSAALLGLLALGIRRRRDA